MNKRTRIAVLAAVLAVIAAGAPVWAQSEADFQTKEKDGALTITKYVGWDTELVIPASIGGKPVRAIGESAFEKAKLTSVTFPAGLTSIGYRAFSGNELTRVTFAAGLVTIGNRAFEGNNLNAVVLPASLRKIGDSAFSGNLFQDAELVIPEGVTDISSSAFGDSTFKSVTLPKSIKKCAWFGSKPPAAFILPPQNYSLFDDEYKRILGSGVYYNYLASGGKAGTYIAFVPAAPAPVAGKKKPKTPPAPAVEETAKEQTEGAFTYYLTQFGAVITGYSGNETRLRMPEQLGGVPVTAIGYEAFSREKFSRIKLENILLPPGLLVIAGRAFEAQKLTSVIFPAGLAYIGDRAFLGNQLTSVTFAKGLISIGDYAFGNAGHYTNKLTSVTFPAGLTSIGNGAFSGNELTSVTFAAGLISIGDKAFENCYSLPSITIPDSVKEIGERAFDNCASLVTVTISPIKREWVDNNAFIACRKIDLPSQAALRAAGYTRKFD